jgi:hypothetical protein
VSRSARTARTGIVAASVAAGALLLTSCAPIQTTLPYAPSDGARVELDDRTRANNLMVVSEGEGAEGTLLGALTNSSPEPVTFRLEVDGADPVMVPVEPRETVYLGTEDGVQATLSAVDTIAGANLQATLSAGESSEDFALPVLDDTLPEYAEYLP